jgi:hypothetical protein
MWMIKDSYFANMHLLGDNIKIQCIFMLHKIYNALFSKNLANLVFSKDNLGLCA